MSDARQNRRATIAQLDLERRALVARLDHGRPDESAAQSLMQRIEDLDLAIAATPAGNYADLAVKFARLLAAQGFTKCEAFCLEGAFIEAICEDLKRLAGEQNQR